MAKQVPAPADPTAAAAKDIQARVELFDKSFRELQDKYQLRAIAQVVFPGGAVFSVPIQVIPFGPSQAIAAKAE